MSEIAQDVQEAIDLSSRTLYANSFAVACKALDKTRKKQTGIEDASENDWKDFLQEHWWIIEFMGRINHAPITEEIIQEMRGKFPGFGPNHKIDDLLLHIIKKNLVTSAMPIGFGFQNSVFFEVKDGKILFPQRFVHGLIGVAVFNPVNSDETIEDNYWLEFGAFRTFVSELWGRTDILQRAITLS